MNVGNFYKSPLLVHFIEDDGSGANLWIIRLLEKCRHELVCVRSHDLFSGETESVGVWKKGEAEPPEAFLVRQHGLGVHLIFSNDAALAWSFSMQTNPVPHIYGDCFTDAEWHKGAWHYHGDDEDRRVSLAVTEQIRAGSVRALMLRDPSRLEAEWCFGWPADIYMYCKLEALGWARRFCADGMMSDLRRLLDEDGSVSLAEHEMPDYISDCDARVVRAWGLKGLGERLGGALSAKRWLTLGS